MIAAERSGAEAIARTRTSDAAKDSDAKDSDAKDSDAKASDAARDGELGDLMRAAQAGERSAYARLLAGCQPIIRRAAAGAGVRGDLVEDVVQETLLTLHNARHTYDPSRSFTAWLTVIAQRRGIDALRRAGRRARREVHAPLAYERHADAAADPSRGWAEAARSRELSAAVATLSPGQREAVERLALREESLAEAAAATGRSRGALKVNLHRALKALRGRLSDTGAHDG